MYIHRMPYAHWNLHTKPSLLGIQPHPIHLTQTELLTIY